MTYLKKMVMVIAVVCMAVAFMSVEARAEKKIGVLLFSEETRYVDSKNGVMDALKKAGFGETAVTFTVENAGGNKVKAGDIAKKMNAANPDMVIGIGTSAVVAVMKEVKTIPVVFSMVYDPVDSKIAESWKSSGNNSTGASPRVPMDELLGTLKQLSPVKKLAVLYTPGEKNSETQLKDLQAEQASSGIKVVPVPLSTKEEVSKMMSEVVRYADAMYLTGSSIVGSSMGTIIDATIKAKVITVSHLDDYVEKGVLLGVCADPYAVGYLAGEKAAKVLKGAKPASISIEPLKKMDIILNAKTARAAKINVPDSFQKVVTKTIK